MGSPLSASFWPPAADTYPGRGLVVGLTPDGLSVQQVYWLTGRSEPSRQRRLVHTPNGMETRFATDAPPPAGGDEALLLYAAMRSAHGIHVVSNGEHTVPILDGLRAGRALEAILRDLAHEPDPPHHTPRIFGVATLLNDGAATALLGKVVAAPDDPGRSIRAWYEVPLSRPGVGYALQTYAGDPPLTYRADPYVAPLFDTAQRTAEQYFSLLPERWRVAVAVKHIDLASGAVSYAVAPA